MVAGSGCKDAAAGVGTIANPLDTAIIGTINQEYPW
jgi:hypothetical protein